MHLDLKSPNILIKSFDERDQVLCQIADFGEAQIFRYEINGFDISNPIWLAPERIMEKPYGLKVFLPLCLFDSLLFHFSFLFCRSFNLQSRSYILASYILNFKPLFTSSFFFYILFIYFYLIVFLGRYVCIWYYLLGTSIAYECVLRHLMGSNYL